MLGATRREQRAPKDQGLKVRANRRAQLSRPFGTLHCRYAFPALKRRAILKKSLRDSLFILLLKN